jgi:hypothetical protein
VAAHTKELETLREDLDDLQARVDVFMAQTLTFWARLRWVLFGTFK